MSNALIIGRFQPPTLGHMDVIEKVVYEGYTPIIGLGSINRGQSGKNPFTKDERVKMLTASLDECGIDSADYTFAYINDVGNNKKWVDSIVPDLPEFECVYSGSALVRKLFKDKGFDVKEIEFARNLSATNVRERIYANESWEHLVTDSTAQIIKDIGGISRIKYFMDAPTRISPILTVDGIINYDGNLVLIKRKFEPFKNQYAIPGGHVEISQTPTQAIVREVKEETGLDFEILGTSGYYADPDRDPRGPYLDKVMFGNGTGTLKAGDDAKETLLLPINPEKPPTGLAFDHDLIMKDLFTNPEALKTFLGRSEDD